LHGALPDCPPHVVCSQVEDCDDALAEQEPEVPAKVGYERVSVVGQELKWAFKNCKRGNRNLDKENRNNCVCKTDELKK
jgi:hypothetical protein